ncbi:hypothetical protein Tco_0175578, partial [Tanacetum coccineum]
VREQGVLERGGTRHTHCVFDVEEDPFICRRADALLVLTLLPVFGFRGFGKDWVVRIVQKSEDGVRGDLKFLKNETLGNMF